MSIAAPALSLSRRTLAKLPAGIWVPLLAMAWVFLNVLFMALGIHYSARSPLFSMAAGGIDGGIVGWILIVAFSEKLHAGATGLLGGYGFQDSLNKFELTNKYVGWIHSQLDPVLDAVLGPNEPLHGAIQNEIVWIGGTAAAVVLASLIVQLIRTASVKPA